MEDEAEEKVYVAVGEDLQDGFKTLEWALKKWKSFPISIVILHICNCNTSHDFVYTPFGKLPASSVSDEKLQVLRKYEEDKIDKMLSKYITFCGKVKAEILKVEKQDDSIQSFIVDLICKLRITKLIMGITFLKSSSWKSKSVISGSFYVYQHKPDFCEFYIICGGKLVEIMKEHDGVGRLREKGNIRSWIGKMFNDNTNGRIVDGPSSSNGRELQTPWDQNAKELENYFHKLLSFDLEQEVSVHIGDEVQTGSNKIDLPEHMSAEERLQYMRAKINEAHQKIQQQRQETKADTERSAKADWALNLCNSRLEELEARIKEEVETRVEMEKTLEQEKEQLYEIQRDVEEGRNRLTSANELQTELSTKLRALTASRSRAERRLQKAIDERAMTIDEIEMLRRQRDIFSRRVEFCKEKQALEGMAVSSGGGMVRCGYREYEAEDIRLGTEGFSHRLRMRSGGNWTNVYRGRINHTTIAVKMLRSGHGISPEDFHAKVELLNEIRHPHLVAIIGFCSEPKCIIFEYMHNGNLRDNLFTSQRNSRRRNKILKWHDRIRIAHEVGSGLGFLHSAKPKPIVHGHLTPSKILLDRNLVAKISGFSLTQHHDQCDTKPDIRAFGVLLLHLLTGRNWPGLLKAMTMNQKALVRDLDDMAGKWPMDLAKDVAGLAIKCLSVNRDGKVEMEIGTIMEELGCIKKKADELLVKGSSDNTGNRDGDEEDPDDVPSVFLCPIFREVMKNPHVAADGFSYELEAMEEWLGMGHDTSPMTNLRLDHQYLTPNHSLRSLIQDWQSNNRKASQSSS